MIKPAQVTVLGQYWLTEPRQSRRECEGTNYRSAA